MISYNGANGWVLASFLWALPSLNFKYSWSPSVSVSRIRVKENYRKVGILDDEQKQTGYMANNQTNFAAIRKPNKKASMGNYIYTCYGDCYNTGLCVSTPGMVHRRNLVGKYGSSAYSWAYR